MLRSLLLASVVAALSLGCDTAGGESGAGLPGPSFGSGPDRIVKVSGDEQTGAAGEPLADDLVVRVIDGAGNPVPEVRVEWSVEEGAGEVRPDVTETDAGGEAEARLVLSTELRAHTVQATAGRGTSISLTALFEARSTVLPVRVENFRFIGPDGTAEDTVAVGDTVRWTNTDSVDHAVRSVERPAGGEDFESERLAPGGSFRFAPTTEGTWRYACPLHPDSTRGGTLVVGGDE